MTKSLITSLLMLLIPQSSCLDSAVSAFAPLRSPCAAPLSSTALGMGALHRRNKQADLMKKMAEAKRQAGRSEKDDGQQGKSNEDMKQGGRGGLNKRNKQAELRAKMSAAKEGNAGKMGGNLGGKGSKEEGEPYRKLSPHEEFEFLLNSQSGDVLNLDLSNGDEGQYRTRWQEEEEMTAYYKGDKRLYESNPAPVEPFQSLVSVQTSEPLGVAGTDRLVPWLKARHKDYLVILCDPRERSAECRKMMKDMSYGLREGGMLERVMVVNPDSPGENRRFLKKSGLTNKITIYSDVNRNFMRAYTALKGDKGWGLSMFVLADGKVQRLVRGLAGSMAIDVVKNAVKSL